MAPKKKPAAAEKKAAPKKAAPEKKAAEPTSPTPAPAAAGAPVDKTSRVIGALPAELNTNRILTHFDETAGVAIARWEVEQHKSLGNVVVPLMDAFKTRYEKLRAILTGKLMPKREHLLQLRRTLQSLSIEVDATRRNIERETQVDAEQIIERVRSLESMRQSAIKHEVLKIEEELMIIERLARRVEQAGMDEHNQLTTTGVLLTSAAPGSAPIDTIRTPNGVAMVELIQEFGDLFANISQLSIKPVTIQVDFPTNDFPRETAERLEVMARCDKYMHAVQVKDHMLWVALQEQEKAQELLAEERRVSQEYATELASWAEGSQKLARENAVLRQEKEHLQMRNRDLIRILREHNIFYEDH
jgi:hypothetical protein